MIRASLPDILDRTLDEELQMVVIRELADHFHTYEHIRGIMSRRSGRRVYIEIFLGFNGEILMTDVQDVIDTMTHSLETKIPGISISIIPSWGRDTGTT